jgi:hypothetical protein
MRFLIFRAGVAAKPEAQPRFWAPLVPFLVSGLQHKRTVNGDVDNPLVPQFERARSATKSIQYGAGLRRRRKENGPHANG